MIPIFAKLDLLWAKMVSAYWKVNMSAWCSSLQTAINYFSKWSLNFGHDCKSKSVGIITTYSSYW